MPVTKNNPSATVIAAGSLNQPILMLY